MNANYASRRDCPLQPQSEGSQGVHANIDASSVLNSDSPPTLSFGLDPPALDLIRQDGWSRYEEIRIRFLNKYHQNNVGRISREAMDLCHRGNAAAHEGNCVNDATILCLCAQDDWRGFSNSPYAQDFTEIYGMTYVQVLQHKDNHILIEVTNMLGTINTQNELDRRSHRGVQEFIRKVSLIRTRALATTGRTAPEPRNARRSRDRLMTEIRTLYRHLINESRYIRTKRGGN